LAKKLQNLIQREGEIPGKIQETENQALKNFVALLSLGRVILRDALSKELKGLAGGASAMNSDTTIGVASGK